MANSYMTHFDRYKELHEQYTITTDVLGTIPYADRTRMDLMEQQAAKTRLMKNYDVVVEYAGTGYAHTKYRVLKNDPGLSMEDLAIIADSGNLCFGYRSDGPIICVYTD